MIRVFAIIFLILSVLYLCLMLYSRAQRREKLDRWYDDDPDQALDRDTYIRRGLEDYDRSWRKKLLLLVFIVPIGAFATLLYVQNFM